MFLLVDFQVSCDKVRICGLILGVNGGVDQFCVNVLFGTDTVYFVSFHFVLRRCICERKSNKYS